MFRVRISFSFARLFRIRIRCLSKENTNSGVPHPPESSCTVSSKHEQSDTSLAATASPLPIVPIIIIASEQDTSSSSLALTLSEEGSKHRPDGSSPVESLPINTRHSSFQVPPTRTNGSSTVSESLVRPIVHALKAETFVPPEITITSPTPAPDSTTKLTPRFSLAIPAESDAGRNGPCSDSTKTRHRSLFVPPPVRADAVRHSIPARPTVPRVTIKTGQAGECTRQSKRSSLLPIGPSAGTTRREKRDSRWSREVSKRETQEVLRAFGSF